MRFARKIKVVLKKMSKSETVLSNSKILLDGQNITILDALSSSRSDVATQMVMNNMNMNNMNMNSMNLSTKTTPESTQHLNQQAGRK